MLSQAAIQTIIPLAERLDSKKIMISPIPNSPLEELVKASSMIEINPQDKLGWTTVNIGDEIAFGTNTNDPLTGHPPHTMVMDEIVPVVADAVKNHINHARTIVVPMIDQIVTSTEEALKSIPSAILKTFNIIEYKAPELLLNPLFENTVNDFKDTNIVPDQVLSFVIPMTDAETIHGYLKTESNKLNELIDLWLATKETGYLISLWDRFFVNNTRPLADFVMDENKKRRLDDLIALFLIVRNLKDNAPSGVNVPLSKYKDDLSDLWRNLGALLFIELRQYKYDTTEAQFIVCRMDGTNVYVHADNYAKFLSEGGQPEVIFGALLAFNDKGNMIRRASELLEKKEELISSWNRQYAISMTAESNRRFSRVKEIVTKMYQRTLDSDEKIDPNTKNMYFDRFLKELDLISEPETMNLYNMVLKLVCRAQFPHTSAERILTSIETVKAANPELPIREAATAAIIDYISFWIFTQFKITS